MHYISNLDNAFHKEAQKAVKRLAIMGSTGTIGQNALSVVRNAPEMFHIIALAGGKNIELLAKQACEFLPHFLAVQDKQDVDKLHGLITQSKTTTKKQKPLNSNTDKHTSTKYTPQILFGKLGYAFIAALEDVDIVLSAQVGAAGLRATFSAVTHGKTVCLANKESLVLAGTYIRQIAQQTHATILPVDSEHYAIFQRLFLKYMQAETYPHSHISSNFSISSAQKNKNKLTKTEGQQQITQNNDLIKRLILTASGGPFRNKNMNFLKSVTKKDALKHPNWSMGAKITIDSATLMNKGLELIEACHLYGLPMESIDVLVHPQSIVHSLVEWKDGSMLAQLAVPDMRLPIAACLSWPQMLDITINTLSPLDLTKTPLSFEHPNTKNFPCLSLAKQAYKENTCIELNAANEIAVELFLQDKITFIQIPELVEDSMNYAISGNLNTLSTKIDINKIDAQAESSIEDLICKIEERDRRTREYTRVKTSKLQNK